MSWKYLVPAVLLTVASAVAPTLSYADSIGMSSQNGTNFTYDFYAPDGTIDFAAGSTLTLTGLSDVTGVTLSQNAAYMGSVAWDGTSVTYTLGQDTAYNAGAPLDIQLFTVTSNDSEMGVLTYTLQEDSGAETGTIPPTDTADTPEPASLLLMGTGAAVMFGVLRRRGQSAEAPAGLTPAI